MSVRINIFPYFQRFTNGLDVVEVNGRTVSECLNHLAKQFPRLEKQLFDAYGELDDYVGIYVGGELVPSWEKPLTRPVHDEDELSIIYMGISGG